MRQIFLGLGIQNSSGLLAEPNGSIQVHSLSKNRPHTYIKIPLLSSATRKQNSWKEELYKDQCH